MLEILGLHLSSVWLLSVSMERGRAGGGACSALLRLQQSESAGQSACVFGISEPPGFWESGAIVRSGFLRSMGPLEEVRCSTSNETILNSLQDEGLLVLAESAFKHAWIAWELQGEWKMEGEGHTCPPKLAACLNAAVPGVSRLWVVQVVK